MDKCEVKYLIEEMNASIQYFSVDPDRACGSWHAILGKYPLDGCLGAMEYFMSNTDKPPTPHSIKGYCDRRRKEAEQAKEQERGDVWARQAFGSFRGVPGERRIDKIMYVCAQQAASKWLRGDHNEFFGDLLLKAHRLGITFDGIEYDKIRDTGDADAFLKMARKTS